MGNGTSRVLLRAKWPTEARVEALENDADISDHNLREIKSMLNRLFWTVLGLAVSIIASLVIRL